MKNKFIFTFLAACLIALLGMGQSQVDDPVGIFDPVTKQLVESKNQTYRKTKAKPQIKLVSVKSNAALNKIKANKKTAIIAVAHTPKNNVQLIVGSSLKKPLSDLQTGNIIRYAGKDLRSSNSKKFNKGIRTVFNATATLIDQKYNFPGDKNTMTQEQLQKINHPQSMNMVWAIVVAVVATGAFTWYQGWKVKH